MNAKAVKIQSRSSTCPGWVAYYNNRNEQSPREYDERPIACFVAQRIQTEDDDGESVTFDVVRPYVMMPDGNIDDCEVFSDFAFVRGPGSSAFSAAEVEAEADELRRKMGLGPEESKAS